MAVGPAGVWKKQFGFGRSGSLSQRFVGIESNLLVSRKNIVVNKESISIDNDLTKDTAISS